MSQPNSAAPALSPQDLSEIRSLLESRSGLFFDSARDDLLCERVRQHLEAKRLAHSGDLLRLLRSSASEYESLLERLLAREDAFFRYPEAAQMLERVVLPELHMRKFWENPRSLRIWCAGCSRGHEAYSVALTVADALDAADNWTVHILATDLSRQALNHAQRGVYSDRELRALNAHQTETYFARIADQFLVKPRIRNMVTFTPLGLGHSAYLGRFDCIFCLSALEFVAKEKRAAIVQRFLDYLEPGGYLFLGNSNVEMVRGFQNLGHGPTAVYHKPVAATSANGELAE